MMLPTVNYDAAYVGAGPFGITAACLLKAINRDIRVVVIDKRPNPVRNHGLNTASDSINFILDRIDEILNKNLVYTQREALIDLRHQFSFWKGKFIRTNDIENILTEKARKMGVIVLREEKFEVKADKIKILLDSATEESQTELGQVLKAKVITAGEGAHSPFRHGLFENKLTESETLQYLVELKFQVDGHAVPRGVKESSLMSSTCGNYAVESMNKHPMDKDKPVTLHSFVSKDLYDSLRVKDAEGKIKGVFANPWTLNELRERAKQDRHAREVYIQILRYLKDLSHRQGNCKEAKISTLDLTIYRSERAVLEYKGHYVLLGGDAFSGMVLERGWNKAIMEATLNAIAINEYFTQPKQEGSPLPKPFQHYEAELIRIYENEKWWALKKDLVISGVNKIAGLFKNWVFEPINLLTEAKALLESKAAEIARDIEESSAFVSQKVSKHSPSSGKL